jgi:MoxR-like ATPase
MGRIDTGAKPIDEKAVIAAAEQALSEISAIKQAVSDVIFGQESVVEQTLLAVLSGGHALLVGVPGLAKTKLVTTLGTVLGLNSNRIQFTPDLMPSDILGSEVMDQDENGRRSFRFVPGPVFTQLLMADEINRASPRTQSALLQAMQEYHVTVAGAQHDLPRPFHVLATQNPLEQEGTYPLPEAQLDRFLMQVDVPYPEMAAERRILLDTTGAQEAVARPAITMERLMAIQALIRQMPVPESVVDAILELVRAARPGHGNDPGRRNCILGPRPARRPGNDALRPRPRALRWQARPVGRRCPRPCRADPATPHGADLHRARRRYWHPRRHCRPRHPESRVSRWRRSAS